MNSINKGLFKASPLGRFGGAILQAAALMVIAASAIVAAATSRHTIQENVMMNVRWGLKKQIQ